MMMMMMHAGMADLPESILFAIFDSLLLWQVIW